MPASLHPLKVSPAAPHRCFWLSASARPRAARRRTAHIALEPRPDALQPEGEIVRDAGATATSGNAAPCASSTLTFSLHFHTVTFALCCCHVVLIAQDVAARATTRMATPLATPPKTGSAECLLLLAVQLDMPSVLSSFIFPLSLHSFFFIVAFSWVGRHACEDKMWCSWVRLLARDLE